MAEGGEPGTVEPLAVASDATSSVTTAPGRATFDEVPNG